MRSRPIWLTLAFAFAPTLAAQTTDPLAGVLDAMPMRNIGPFRSSAWITSIAVPAAPRHEHLYTIWIGARSGGVWKTTNGGTTWDPVFDSTGVAPVGAITIAPSDPNIVWVGTGDQANARSSYSGKGVYKTTDGGKTWKAMGLSDSHHIARIAIHPTNPNVVYVAAIGHLFSRNEERGVFRTTDGGATWKPVLQVNDHTGAVDLVMDPRTPTTLYASMYDKERMPWRLIESGLSSGVYKTTNGGDNWQKLGGGLPTGDLGRIGIDAFLRNPNVLYALVENHNPPPSGGRGLGAGGIIGNELYRSDDAGATWRKTSDINVAGGKAPYSFNQIKIDPNNVDRVIVTSDIMFVTDDGGKTWNDQRRWPSGYFRRAFGDFRAMWFDADDSLHVMLGSDGGLQVSNDGGHTSDFFPNLKIGEAYAVGVDMDDPYHVYAGFQDHDSWKGPVNGRMGVITLEEWVTVGPGDGMYNVVDPVDSRWVYNTRELNQMGRLDQRTGVRTDIRPRLSGGGPPLRFNWIAPIALSPFDPATVYAGAQMLFRSPDRGDTWAAISPDLTTNDASKIGFPSTPYCNISSISPSPLARGMIWVGTDDGKVQLTRDDGATWSDATAALVAAGAPGDRWVSRVFASPHDSNTAFVSKTGFRNDDFNPYLYRTRDGGRTWTSIAGNLPKAPINVVIQDRVNAHALVVGNDIGVFVSIDDGAHWTRLKSNLPPAAVHDLTIHPRENDLVIGTYGRALWVGDVMPLHELTPEVLAKPVHLFDIEPKARYGFGSQGMNYQLYGNKYLQVQNEPEGLVVQYWLKSAAAAGVPITITTALGASVRTVNGTGRAGLNRVVVPFGGGGGGAPGGRGGAGTGGGGALAVGAYSVTIEVAGQKLTKPATVRERMWR